MRALCHAPKLRVRLIFQKIDWLHDPDLRAHRVVDNSARGEEGDLSARVFNRHTSLRDLGLI
jgi:hypothetical protein